MIGKDAGQRTSRRGEQDDERMPRCRSGLGLGAQGTVQEIQAEENHLGRKEATKKIEVGIPSDEHDPHPGGGTV